MHLLFAPAQPPGFVVSAFLVDAVDGIKRRYFLGEDVVSAVLSGVRSCSKQRAATTAAVASIAKR